MTTLALNSSASTPFQENLFVFGLNPLEEAKQISEKISETNLLRVALLHSDSHRDKSLVTEFQRETERDGSHIVATASYGQDTPVANAVASLLSTSNSKQRSQTIQAVTGLKLEKRPERRQDIDAVVLFSDHQTAKQIKPLLAFNFADDIPVFGNSNIHQPDKIDTNNDLNGVHFLDIPWVFAKTNNLRSQIESLRTEQATRYSRFYALGADAFTLTPRISIMRELPNTYIQGLTGKLSINSNGTVSRKLDWAVYRRGKAIPNNR